MDGPSAEYANISNVLAAGMSNKEIIKSDIIYTTHSDKNKKWGISIWRFLYPADAHIL